MLQEGHLHLHEELCLDPPRRFTFIAFPTLTTQRVDFIDEDNGGSIFTSHLEQIVGDRKGAVFGGLVEAPLQPIIKKKYQGTNNCFVFTNVTGRPAIYRPTGANNYFTFCSIDYLAMGGGGHFALYLDGDLLNGSSSTSETFNNPCLSRSRDFEVKDVELWGFVNASKYDEMLTICRTEKPGIWNL